MTHYLISEASRKLNVEAHVLRYWEEELELEIPRNELGHRYYTEKQLALFQKIKELKELGYQLKAIKSSLSEEYGPEETAKEAGFLLRNVRQNGPEPYSDSREISGNKEKRFQVLEGQTAERSLEKTTVNSDGSALHNQETEGTKETGPDRLERLSKRLSASASGTMTEAVLEKMTGKLAEGIVQVKDSEEVLPFEEEAENSEELVGQAVDGEEAVSEESEKADKEMERLKAEQGKEDGRDMGHPKKDGRKTEGEETALELVGAGGLTTSPEKMQQFQTIMTDVLSEALRRNQDSLSREVGGRVSEKLVKEMNYLMRDREEREEERYRKLDETIRACQRVQRQKSEAAATRVPVRGMKKSRFPWGRRKDS